MGGVMIDDIGLLILNWDASWVGKGDALGSGSWGSVLYLFFEKETVGDQGMLAVPIQGFFAELQVQDDDKLGGVFDPRARNKFWCLENIFS